MNKEIRFTQEEMDLILDLIGKTRKPNGSRKLELCKDILEKFNVENSWADLHLTDVETGKRYALEFTWFAFPGLQNEGYRIEGFYKTGEFDGFNEGEIVEFGSLILKDGQAKIVNW